MARVPSETLVIPHRFRGPPESGNGGWVAGRLAAHLEGPATVRLHAPPPLDAPLQLTGDGEAIELSDGERLLARACPAKAFDLAVPPAPSFDEALDAQPGYLGFTWNLLGGCFVCGTGREPGDGLRVFAAPLGDGVAAAWRPDASLVGPDGRVEPAFLWAALDCPGAFAIPDPPGACLLGEISGEIVGAVDVDEPCVVLGWALGREGRKRFTGTALFGADGALRGHTRAVWIEIPSPV